MNNKYLGALIGSMGIQCIPIWDPLFNQPNMLPGNISIANYRGHIVWAVRLVNYLYYPFWSDPDVNRLHFFDMPANSRIVIGSLDGYFPSSIVELPEGTCAFMGMYKGAEDPRLYVCNNELYMNVSRPDMVPDKVVQVIYRFKEDLSGINKEFTIDSPNQMEKNWAPIDGKEHEFLYNPNTGSTVYLVSDATNPNQCILQGNTDFYGTERGSSQVLHTSAELSTTIVHTTWFEFLAEYRRFDYSHYIKLMRFNEETRTYNTLDKVPFRFLIPGIEFCCGIAMDRENFYISFSCWDASVFIMTIPLNSFNQLIKTLKNEELPQPTNIFNELYQNNNHESINNGMLLYCKYLPFTDVADIVNGCRGRIEDRILDSILYNRLITQ